MKKKAGEIANGRFRNIAILTQQTTSRSVAGKVPSKSVIAVASTEHSALDNCLLDFIRVSRTGSPDRMWLV